VSRVCAALAEATESTTREGHRQGRVRDKTSAWERPLRRRDDLAELGEAAPTGPVLGVRVPDEGAEEGLAELGADAWACRVPRRLVAETCGPA
jgi:hypothetical protein